MNPFTNGNSNMNGHGPHAMPQAAWPVQAANPLAGIKSPISAQFVLHSVLHWWKQATVAGIILAAIGVLAVWLSFIPTYRATAYFEIKNKGQFIVKDINSSGGNYARNQIELIRSPIVLQPVVGKKEISQLDELDGEPDAVDFIRRHLSVRSVGGTELFTLSYDSHSPDAAALVANTIMQAFVKFRDQQTDTDRAELIAILEQEKARREPQLTSSREKLRQQYKQIYGAQRFINESFMPETNDITVGRLNEQIAQSTVNREVKQAQLRKMRETAATPTVVPEEVVDQALMQRPEMAGIFAQLDAARMRLKDMEDKSKPNMQVAQKEALRAEIKKLEGRFADESTRLRPVVRDELAANLRQTMEIQIEGTDAEIEGMKLREETLAELVREEIQKAEQIGSQTAELEIARAELRREEEIFNLLAERISNYRTEQFAPDRLTVLQQAPVPTRPLEVIPYKKMGMAGGACFMIPFMLAVLWELRVRRISNSDQLAQELSLPVIGEITTLPARPLIGSRRSMARFEQHRDTFEESIDQLRTSLVLSDELADVQVFVVASAVSREGKTSLASQLAVSLARASGAPTLLIDADMRHPDMHEVFEIELSPGLAEVLGQECSLQDALVTDWSELVHLLPAGQLNRNPHLLLGNGAFQKILDQMRPQYRYIVVDAPPVLAASEARSIAKAGDGVIICTMRTITRAPQVRLAFEKLVAAGARPLGVVMSGVPPTTYGYKYGGYPYYGYSGSYGAARGDEEYSQDELDGSEMDAEESDSYPDEEASDRESSEVEE